jgi:hypothetical protein
MAVEVAVIITDTPPLITLAAAQRLDYLHSPAARFPALAVENFLPPGINRASSESPS